jgi:hypothetical protein
MKLAALLLLGHTDNNRSRRSLRPRIQRGIRHMGRFAARTRHTLDRLRKAICDRCRDQRSGEFHRSRSRRDLGRGSAVFPCGTRHLIEKPHPPRREMDGPGAQCQRRYRPRIRAAYCDSGLERYNGRVAPRQRNRGGHLLIRTATGFGAQLVGNEWHELWPGVKKKLFH